ncbi:MAG: hypothetical protein ABIF71_08520, partial [Planctomycetota bacterium]
AVAFTEQVTLVPASLTGGFIEIHMHLQACSVYCIITDECLAVKRNIEIMLNILNILVATKKAQKQHQLLI